MFDELKVIGLDAFAKKHDPYRDIPLNENLSQPVSELPVPATDKSSPIPVEEGRFEHSDRPARQRAKRKR